MTTEAMQEAQDQTNVTTQEQQLAVEAPAESSAEPTQEVTQEAAPTNDAADFEAGFAQARGDEPPEAEPAEEPEPKLFAGYTEDEVKQALTKAAEVDKLREQQNKLFGTLGQMKQVIEELRSQPKPSQAQLQLSKDKFARLSKDFPEMAEMLAADLSDAIGSVPQSSGEDFTSRLEQVKTELKQESEAKLLTLQHRDWRDVVKSQEFAQWTQTLDPQVRNELVNSWDSTFIGERISEFKDWKTKAQASQQAKQKRLEAAITPRGTAPAANTETEADAFMAGFKKARGVA